MIRNVRIDNSANILNEDSRYTPRVMLDRAPQPVASQGVGVQLTAALTVAIGLLGISCAVLASDGMTLVAGNPLAESVVAQSGWGALDIYRMVTVAFGLMLTGAGVRTAAISARSTRRLQRLTPGTQAVLTGLVATNLALIAWWTGWLFV